MTMQRRDFLRAAAQNARLPAEADQVGRLAHGMASPGAGRADGPGRALGAQQYVEIDGDAGRHAAENLTAADARALGIRRDASTRKMMLGTANGTVVGFRTTLREIRLGDIVVRNVEAVVLPEGALSMSLLGNSFLGKLQGYEVQTGRMVLRG